MAGQLEEIERRGDSTGRCREVGMARKRVGWSWVGHSHLSKVHGERSEELELGGAPGLEARRGQGARDKATARKSR